MDQALSRECDGERSSGRKRRAAIWAAIALIAFGLILFNPLADLAVRFNKESLVGGTAIYSTLRVLNSVMSVAKDADIEGSIAVVSTTISPGQLLQPVTNTIDRIADLLFLLIIGSGLITVLLAPVAKIGAAIVFVSALFIASLELFPRAGGRYASALLRSLCVLGLLAAALIPSAFAGAALLGDHITKSAWQDATRRFNGMESHIESGTPNESLAVSEPISSAPPAVGTEPAAPLSDKGAVGRTFSKIGTAFSASKDAVSEAANAAGSLAASVRYQAASNVRIVRDGVALSGQLFDASVQIAVAYLAKLVILPLMIFGGAIFLLRSAPRYVLPRHEARISHE